MYTEDEELWGKAAYGQAIHDLQNDIGENTNGCNRTITEGAKYVYEKYDKGDTVFVTDGHEKFLSDSYQTNGFSK